VEILRDDCTAIARVAAPDDSVRDITKKLENEGRHVHHQMVWRRLTMMRDALAEAGDFVLSRESRPTRYPTAGRIARCWAKYQL
jgi:glucose-6-phosphate dehydrogenase assembly protein OpcA